MLDPCRIFRQLARNARLANARLDRACQTLQPGEWEAERISFFPSLKATMMHLIDADRYYIDTFRGDWPGPKERSGPLDNTITFSHEREEIDKWIVAFCESLTITDLSRRMQIHWPEKTLTEALADTLLHVFTHVQHHRGQIHSMLSSTSVRPPQIDEFILTSDVESRTEDLQILGWNEDWLTR
jgi:uncharacterized damage-inducible protein DinB